MTEVLRVKEKSPLLNGISTVIWDMDGTLTLDKDRPDKLDFHDLLLQKRIEQNVVTFIQSVENCTEESARESLQKIKSEGKSLRKAICQTYDIDQPTYFKTMWNIPPEEVVTLRPYAVEVLDYLKQENIFLLLVTKAPSIWQQNVVNHFKLHQFDGVFTGDVSDDKSNIFKNIAGIIDPKTILSIGDSLEKDIKPSKEFNMNTLQVVQRNDLEILLPR